MSRFSRYWQKFKNQAPSIFQKGSPARTVVVEFLMIYSGVYVFTSNVVGFTLCVGPSMLPTIDQNGELAFIDRFNYKFARKDYKVGDVVISDSMDDPNKTVCKRIKGVAGDVVYYYNKDRIPVVIKVPDEHVWLLGDNPANSNDSRYYGPVPISLLRGRVFAKLGLNPLHLSDVDTIFLKEPEQK